jgi:UDP-N-acetylmuramyl tripeptide synthase
MCCDCDDFKRKYREPCTMRVNLKVPGMCNVENALAVFASNLILDFDLEYIKDKIENFPGVNGRFEKIDMINEVNIFMDAAHNPEAMERLLEGMNLDGRLIITVDNPDTLTTRDKFKVGSVLKKYVDVVIASAKNETTEEIDINAAQEVIEGAKGLETYTTENIVDAIVKALEVADKGDTIIHIGPGVVNAYEKVKSDIICGISTYKNK